MTYLASNLIKVGGLLCIALATLTGCVASSASGESASSSVRTSSADQISVNKVGLLTLKGAELGAWWALTETSGEVWRLEPNAMQQEQLRKWQNRRIEVDGTVMGTYLSNRILRINRAVLKAE